MGLCKTDVDRMADGKMYMTKCGQKNADEGKLTTMLFVFLPYSRHVRCMWRANQIHGLPIENAEILLLTVLRSSLLFCFICFSDHTEKNYLTMLQNIFIRPCSRQRYDVFRSSTFNIAKVPYLIFDSFFRV